MLKNIKSSIQKHVYADPLAKYRLDQSSQYSWGQGGVWKVSSATHKDTGEERSVFSCDLVALKSKCAGTELADAIGMIKEGVKNLSKVLHPNILRILEPLADDVPNKRLVFVSEKVSDVIPSQAAADLTDVERLLSVHDLGEALDFLHHKAGIALRGISQKTVTLGADGRWKFCDFTLACSVSETSSLELPTRSWMSPIAPDLDFCAPEVVTGSFAFPCSDVFSFGVLSFLLLRDVKLFNAAASAEAYHLQLRDAIPQLTNLVGITNHLPRSALTNILTQGIFADKKLQLVLQIEAYPTSDSKDKLATLKALFKTVSELPSRTIAYRVLPLLKDELKNPALLRYVIPILLESLPALSDGDFAVHMKPILDVYMVTSDPNIAHMFIEKCDVLLKHYATPAALDGLVLPLLEVNLRQQNGHFIDVALAALNTIASRYSIGAAKLRSFGSLVAALVKETAHFTAAMEFLKFYGQQASQSEKEAVVEVEVSGNLKLYLDDEARLKALLALLKSMTAESTRLHISTVTLPALCPLLDTDVNRKLVEDAIFDYIKQTGKKHADPVALNTTLPQPRHESTSFFAAPAPPPSQTQQQQQAPLSSTSMFGDLQPARPHHTAAAPPPSTQDDVMKSFGF